MRNKNFFSLKNDASMKVMADASTCGNGGILLQQVKVYCVSVPFTIQKLIPSEIANPVHEK